MKEKIKVLKNWIGVDGKLHIAVSIIIYLFVAIPIFMCYGIFFSILVGFVIAFMLGCIKELNDMYIQKDNTKIESSHDTICNLIGIGIGIIYNLFLMIFI